MRHNKNILILLSLILSACNTSTNTLLPIHDGAPKHEHHIDHRKVKNAVPKVERLSKTGNPHSYVVFGKRYHTLSTSKGYDERGIASWYGTKFHHRKTSSGEPYDMFAMTAAHKTLPLPTYAEVTNLHNNKRIIVKINDRGPFKSNRIIDLSYTAAKKLGITKKGTGLVEVRAIDPIAWRKQRNMPHKTIRHPHIYLQVGAFSSKQNAEKLDSVIGRMTHETVRVTRQRINGRQLYRVQIGPMKNVQQADNAYRKVAHLGLGEPVTLVE